MVKNYSSDSKSNKSLSLKQKIILFQLFELADTQINSLT